MSESAPSYVQATRHPLAAVIFVVPLLIFYECGLYQLDAVPADEIRNGADAWLRGLLQHVGISPIFGAPTLLLGGLLAWSVWRREDRPRDFVGLWIGMVIESAAFAGVSRLERQRMVNRALGDIPGERVHALAIKARAPGE